MPAKGTQKIAAVLLGLDKEVAASLLRGVPEQKLEQLSQAMVQLSLDPNFQVKEANAALEEFGRRLQGERSPAGDFQDLLERALGEDRAAPHVERIDSSRRSTAPFGAFEKLPPQEVAEVLLDENEQLAALVLSQVGPGTAARILGHVPKELQPRLVLRVVHCEPPPIDVQERIAATLLERFGPVAPKSPKGDAGSDKSGHVAAILNFLDEDMEKHISGELATEDEQLFQRIDEQRVTMDDLLGIDKKAMQKILGNIDTKVLTLALKGASPEIEEKVLGNVSKRAKETILEERELLGAVPRSEVEGARKELLLQVRVLVKSGEVVLLRGDSGLVE